jgi:hypothetical protein
MNDIGRCTTCVKRNKDCEHPEHAKKHPEEGCREWSNGEVFVIDEKDIIRVEDYE